MADGVPNLKPHEILRLGRARKARRRVGRGNGSGRGKTSGRGQKGAGARSGTKRNLRFEGGQTPILMRFPRLPGFNNSRTSVRFEPVNVEALNVFADGEVVGPAELIERRLARRGPVKILGRGELSAKLTVRATHFSAAAIAKIEAAGGTAEQIGPYVDENGGSADADTDA